MLSPTNLSSLSTLVSLCLLHKTSALFLPIFLKLNENRYQQYISGNFKILFLQLTGTRILTWNVRLNQLIKTYDSQKSDLRGV